MIGIFDVAGQHVQPIVRAANDEAIAATVLSPNSAISRARRRGVGVDVRRQPVLLQEATALRQCLHMTAHAFHGLERRTRDSHQAMLDLSWSARPRSRRLVCGNRLCRSATRPAIEFSTGIIASAARPGAPLPSRLRKSGTATSSCRETPTGMPCRNWRRSRPGTRWCCWGVARSCGGRP